MIPSICKRLAEEKHDREIDASYEDADVYFPNFDKSKYKKKVLKKNSYNNINYSFVLYDKEKNNER